MATTQVVVMRFVGQDKVTPVTNRIGGEFSKLGKTAVKAGLGAVAVGAAAATAALTGLVVSSVKTAASFESAFAGVTKTTDGLRDQFGKLNSVGQSLRKEFVNLSRTIPVSFEDLSRIGELGGQLGISRDKLIGFTKTIAQLGVTTNLSNEEAATSFAQLFNVMGEGQDKFDEAGSAIVALGNNFATNERDIANFSSRISGAAKIAGLSTADVLGISTAFSSVGVQAEAGGTAVQKVLLAINSATVTGGDKLEKFAAVAGMSASDFAQAWRTDAAKTFKGFVAGLGRQGDQAIMTLDELELKDSRLIRSFLSLANAGDLLGRTLDTSNSAWARNTALSEEAAQRFSTTESQLQLLRNAVAAMKDVLGRALLPSVNQVIKAFTEFVTQNEGVLVPFFEKLAGWIADALPVAMSLLTTGIAKMQQAWASLQPVFQFVQDNFSVIKTAVVALGIALAAVFGSSAIVGLISMVGAAIGLLLSPVGLLIAGGTALALAWQKNWGGIRDAVTQAWETSLKPAFSRLQNWLANVLPVAIMKLKSFWTNTLQPALARVWEWIRDTALPIAGDLVLWLSENLPQAISKLTRIWETELLPRLRKVWNFIAESLSPALSSLWDWLQSKLPASIAEVQLWWDSFSEKIGHVVNTIRGNLMVWLEKLLEWFKIFRFRATPIIEEFKKNFAEAWTDAKDRILPALTLLKDSFLELWSRIGKLLGLAEGSGRKISIMDIALGGLKLILNLVIKAVDLLAFAIDAFARSLSFVIGLVTGGMNAFRRFGQTLGGLKLPRFLQANSPTPFEVGLRGIAAALSLVNSEMKTMGRGLNMSLPGGDLGGMSVLGPASSGGIASGRVTNDNRQMNLTIHSDAQREPLVADFNMMKARLAGT